MDVGDPFDGVLPLTSPVSLPKSPDISNDGTVASPTNNQPIAGPSKDPQPGPSTAATNTPKTTPTKLEKRLLQRLLQSLQVLEKVHVIRLRIKPLPDVEIK